MGRVQYRFETARLFDTQVHLDHALPNFHEREKTGFVPDFADRPKINFGYKKTTVDGAVTAQSGDTTLRFPQRAETASNYGERKSIVKG